MKNIIKVLKSPIWIIGFFVWIAIIAIPTYIFLDRELIINNMWCYFYITEIVLTIVISILFWLFVWATLYKVKYFSTWNPSAWIFGWIIWVLVSGCPACSITLASYIGLAGIISVFPYHGLELKIISIFLLIYANYSTMKNLEVCKVKIKK